MKVTQETQEHLTDLAVSSVASKATYMGSASMGLGWLMTNEAAVVGGLIVGVTGLIINWWYKRKADKREEELHKLKLQGFHSSRSPH